MTEDNWRKYDDPDLYTQFDVAEVVRDYGLLIKKLNGKLEDIKPLILELFDHADHGLDSHAHRSFEIRQLRDKIIRIIGETPT